ncbi:alpha/beta fold hydrolase [Ferruginibacter sp. HRS2-29]|uniref:alpha/beta fold hydrolase n=1 Tax=Ferruginibacter sp. HRS2-29 TaxID=2487334 RepID=UPI0020CE4F31|nr:alpha/beta hydrolase [Ferruginibacter sp. HRS2-29]MCP9752640.1 alpha/beta fold hydrolase [Ferruginibacter sp. HRS2-29]
MPKRSFSLLTGGDHPTPMQAWLPDTEPACILHIVHGMAEYAARYEPIAAMLVAEGIGVYAHDNRAHGPSIPAEDLGIGEEDWFYKQVEDIRHIVQYLRTQHPGKKIILLGHSMGSFLSQRFFQLYGKEIDGLVLSASNGNADPLMGIGIGVAYLQYKLMGKRYRSTLIDTLSFGQFNRAFRPNRTTNDWLSRDEKEVDKYVADPLCGFVCSAGFFYYFFKGIRDAFKKENIRQIPTDIPVYCFGGDQDPVGLKGKGFLALISKWKAAGVKDITYDLYPGGRHEMLNELNREEVVRNLVSFLFANRP